MVTLFNQPMYSYRKLVNLPQLVEAVEASEVRLLFSNRINFEKVYQAESERQHLPDALRRLRASAAFNPPLIVPPSRVPVLVMKV